MALTDKLTAIGDAIREKTETTELIPLAEMPNKVNEVFEIGSSTGYSEGYLVGNSEGQQEGWNNGYEAGRKAEYDQFWDFFQNKGSRKYYERAFMHGGDGVIEAKYPIVCNNSSSAANWVFGYSYITEIKTDVVITRPANASYTITATATFNTGHSLKTISKLIIDETIVFSNTFGNCSVLENLTIEGTIGQNGFQVSGSPKLTHDSLMSIINALKKFTDGTTKTVALGATNLAKLTDAEKAIATQKGWTLA